MFISAPTSMGYRLPDDVRVESESTLPIRVAQDRDIIVHRQHGGGATIVQMQVQDEAVQGLANRVRVLHQAAHDPQPPEVGAEVRHAIQRDRRVAAVEDDAAAPASRRTCRSGGGRSTISTPTCTTRLRGRGWRKTPVADTS